MSSKIPNDNHEFKSFLQFMYIDTWNEGSSIFNHEQFMNNKLGINDDADIITCNDITTLDYDNLTTYTVIYIRTETNYNESLRDADSHFFSIHLKKNQNGTFYIGLLNTGIFLNLHTQKDNEEIDPLNANCYIVFKKYIDINNTSQDITLPYLKIILNRMKQYVNLSSVNEENYQYRNPTFVELRSKSVNLTYEFYVNVIGKLICGIDKDTHPDDSLKYMLSKLEDNYILIKLPKQIVSNCAFKCVFYKYLITLVDDTSTHYQLQAKIKIQNQIKVDKCIDYFKDLYEDEHTIIQLLNKLNESLNNKLNINNLYSINIEYLNKINEQYRIPVISNIVSNIKSKSIIHSNLIFHKNDTVFSESKHYVINGIIDINTYSCLDDRKVQSNISANKLSKIIGNITVPNFIRSNIQLNEEPIGEIKDNSALFVILNTYDDNFFINDFIQISNEIFKNITTNNNLFNNIYDLIHITKIWLNKIEYDNTKQKILYNKIEINYTLVDDINDLFINISTCIAKVRFDKNIYTSLTPTTDKYNNKFDTSYINNLNYELRIIYFTFFLAFLQIEGKPYNNDNDFISYSTNYFDILNEKYLIKNYLHYVDLNFRNFSNLNNNDINSLDYILMNYKINYNKIVERELKPNTNNIHLDDLYKINQKLITERIKVNKTNYTITPEDPKYTKLWKYIHFLIIDIDLSYFKNNNSNILNQFYDHKFKNETILKLPYNFPVNIINTIHANDNYILNIVKFINKYLENPKIEIDVHISLDMPNIINIPIENPDCYLFKYIDKPNIDSFFSEININEKSPIINKFNFYLLEYLFNNRKVPILKTEIQKIFDEIHYDCIIKDKLNLFLYLLDASRQIDQEFINLFNKYNISAISNTEQNFHENKLNNCFTHDDKCVINSIIYKIFVSKDYTEIENTHIDINYFFKYSSLNNKIYNELDSQLHNKIIQLKKKK